MTKLNISTIVLVIQFILGSCNAGTCVEPEVDHGEVRGHGDSSHWTGRVSCHPGYSLVGPGHLKCGDGVWSGDTPVCVIIDGCEQEDLEDISNGWRTPHRKTKYRGGVWSYHCHRGWRLHGPELVWCDDGSWTYDGGHPVCVKPGCDERFLSKLRRQRHIRLPESSSEELVTFSCSGSGVTGSLYCNGSHWLGDTKLCGVDKIMEEATTTREKLDEIVYNTVYDVIDVDGDKDVIIIRDIIEAKKSSKSLATLEFQNIHINLLIFMTHLLTNYH